MDFALDSIDTRTLSETGVDVAIHKLNSTEPLLAANGTPVTIKVLGPDSSKYRALSRSNIRKRLSKMAENKQTTDADLDENESDALDMLAACTVGWVGVLNTKGEPIECTVENARKLYEAYPVVREQVDGFIGERANFLKASSKA